MTHRFHTRLRWTGDRGVGTARYDAYGRDHVIEGAGKATAIAGSADAAFRGDATRWNPEELLLASLSACHQLWYLHLCADAGVIVVGYRDDAEATLTLAPDGSGRISGATLRPQVTIAAGSDAERALTLHGEAARLCFIGQSVKFPVTHQAHVELAMS